MTALVRRMNDDPCNSIDDQSVARIQAYCRARAGKTPATDEERALWEAFFWKYSMATRRMAEKLGLRGHDVDDCQQEAWTEIFLRLANGGFKSQRGRLSSWVFAVARNKAVDILRSKRAFTPSERDGLDWIPSSREDDPADAYNRRRDRRLVHEALNTLLHQLSAATFHTLYGYWIEEKDSGQIAQELGLTMEEIRYRRRRAKQFLCEILSRTLDPGEMG